MSDQANIIVIDDEPALLGTLQLFLSDAGFNVRVYESPLQALRSIPLLQPTPDLILTDLRMPEMNGMELIRELKGHQVDSEVLVLTAVAEDKTAIEAMQLGAYDYITKPYDLDELLLLVTRAIEHRRLRIENIALKAHKETTDPSATTYSPVMQKIYSIAEEIARTDSTVLLTGESGVGKEVLARYIHRKSNRADKPFIPINCGAIPESLVEAELFGAMAGAYTGANADRVGLFEQADGGTLLLDEIGELPLPMQVKLLRVLQERTLRRVGGTTEIPIDVRILCATNRQLLEETQKGSFREDLYYRINVIHLDIPSLRERPDDILPLAQLFAEGAMEKHNKPNFQFTDEHISFLQNHAFPGNVRELQNWTERCVLLDGIGLANTHATPTESAAARNETASTLVRKIMQGQVSYQEVVDNYERTLLEEILALTGGNQKDAARKIAMTPRQLRYKVAKLLKPLSG